MRVRVAPDVAEGIVFVPHGWSGEANANLLTDAQCRECILGYPDMKSLMCTITKEDEAASARVANLETVTVQMGEAMNRFQRRYGS
jgi:predicted molibdopterin-dependent oxidoreductase YjgC